MSQLAPIVPKLRKLLPMLSSESEGEQLATVAAIKRTLSQKGFDLHDLADAIGAEPARHQVGPTDSAPVWVMLSTASKLAWLAAVAEIAGPGSWPDSFVSTIKRRLVAGLPITPAQKAKAQELIAEAWAKGAHP